MRALQAALTAVALVLASAVAPVAATTGTSGAGGDAAVPSFDQDRYAEHRGDVVAMTLALPANGTGRLTLGRSTRNTTVTVRDDGDGHVRLRFNTYTGGWSAAGADTVAAVENATARVPDGEYRLTLRANGSVDETTLVLEPSSLERVGTWQTADEVAFADVADVRGAIADGTLRRATAVNGSHLLVVGVEATGLAGALASAEGENSTARFRAVMAEHGDLKVVQHEDTVGLEQDPAVLHVLDGPGVRVLADPDDDTYFLVVDAGAARLTRGDDEVDPEQVTRYDADGMWLEVRATVAGDSPLAAEDEHAGAVVAPRGAAVSTAPDGVVHFGPERNQTVTGTTNVGAGWNVTVVLAGEDVPATDADESFRRTREVRLRPDEERYGDEYGRFRAAFDLRAVSPGTDATVDVRFENRSLLEERVPAAVEARRASVTGGRVDRGGEFTAVEVTASLSTGGFVVLHEGSRDGPVVGHSDFLPAGNHTVGVYVGEPTDAAAVVAVAHRDADHNQWFDGSDVDPAYDADDPSATVPLSPTPTPTGSATAEPPGGTDTAATGDGPTTTTTTGFGVAVAVAALALAALTRFRSR